MLQLQRYAFIPNVFKVLLCLHFTAGEAPDNALGFDIMLDNAISQNLEKRFGNVNFAVFGTGNKHWCATYQRIPKNIDVTLATLGGHRFADKGFGVRVLSHISLLKTEHIYRMPQLTKRTISRAGAPSFGPIFRLILVWKAPITRIKGAP